VTSKGEFDPTTESKRWILYISLAILVSWLGLWGLIHLAVSSTTKTLFFLLLFTGMTTTVMPAAAYLNARFGQYESRNTYRSRFVRQSIWVGACAVVGAWLQMQRVLSLTLGLILVAVFALIETFLITREKPASEL
jgi:hypothetical protein